ncbi:hypothetical protein MHBO_002821 [Bonamia ostreae]|uniref:UspA domain-containing protein n=1 Tax=Bonamia ostreae TaxID=126728 RepID=A0ABV2ANM2_9EUKA
MEGKGNKRVIINHLVVPKQMKDKRKILIAVDGSEHSTKCIEYAKKHICQKDDVVMFIRAIEKLAYPYLSVEISAKNQVLTRLADNMTAKCLDNFKDNERVGYLVQGVDFRTTLIEAADKLSPDLFIIGSRGKGAVKRLLLGSVSRYLLNHLNIPTLVVK